MSLSFHLEYRFISSLYSLIRYNLKIKWHCGWKIYMGTGFVQTGRGWKGMDSLTIISGNFPCIIAWWRHQMETFSAFLAICAGNSPTTGEIPAQKPVTQNFDVFVDLRLDERLSKQSWGWWFETPWRPLWHHNNEIPKSASYVYRPWYQPSSSLTNHTAPKSGFIRYSFSSVCHELKRMSNIVRSGWQFTLVALMIS